MQKICLFFEESKIMLLMGICINININININVIGILIWVTIPALILGTITNFIFKNK